MHYKYEIVTHLKWHVIVFYDYFLNILSKRLDNMIFISFYNLSFVSVYIFNDKYATYLSLKIFKMVMPKSSPFKPGNILVYE